MRTILHAKFGDQLAKHSCASDKVPRASLSPQMCNNSVEEFEAALTKARATWRGSRGQPRPPLAMPVSCGVDRTRSRRS